MSVVVLTGGVGGAKLVDGLANILPGGALTAIVNTADDFTHLGLRICPDLDSVLYLLAGKSDQVRGWGVADESWNFMSSLADWGGETWFNLGDRDLALHVLRSAALATGESLTAFTARMAEIAGVDVNLLPMSEDNVSTVLSTDVGILAFQSYFVEHGCRPKVFDITFEGSAQARPSPAVMQAMSAADLETVIIAPSNPYLSIDPILAVPGIEKAIKDATVPVVAISPLVDGKAVKGPTAKLMEEMALRVADATIAAHYAHLIDGLLVHHSGGEGCDFINLCHADTLMLDADGRRRVANSVLEFALSLR